MIALAEEQPPKNLKEASFKIGHRMDLHRFIVPVQVLLRSVRRETGGRVGAIYCGALYSVGAIYGPRRR